MGSFLFESDHRHLISGSTHQVRWTVCWVWWQQSRMLVWDVLVRYILLHSHRSLHRPSKSSLRRNSAKEWGELRLSCSSARILTTVNSSVSPIAKYTQTSKKKHVFGPFSSILVSPVLINDLLVLVRYLKSYHDNEMLNTTRGFNVQEECKKIKGISRIAAQVVIGFLFPSL